MALLADGMTENRAIPPIGALIKIAKTSEQLVGTVAKPKSGSMGRGVARIFFRGGGSNVKSSQVGILYITALKNTALIIHIYLFICVALINQ